MYNRSYRSSGWQKLASSVRYYRNKGLFQDIEAGIATFGFILLVIVGGALFC